MLLIFKNIAISSLYLLAYWVIGRLPLDIVSAHPTTSRYHCIIQYRPQIYESEDPDEAEIKEGWFVYDLGMSSSQPM